MIATRELQEFGSGLNRPESVLAIRRGDVFVCDRRGGVAHVHPDRPATLKPCRPTEDFLANGIALTAEGAFLIANLAPSGGVWRLDRDGQVRPFLLAVDGVSMSTVNFVSVDRANRVWIAVSTRQVPRELGFRRANADGYIVVVDARGARIAAEGLWFTNEAVADPTGSYLYVNETLGRRVLRFPVTSAGDLGRREVVAEFTDGVFPDGLAFDAEGGVWITSVVSNRIIRIARDGSRTAIVDDSDAAAIAAAERSFAADTFSRADIDGGRAGRLGNASSLAFGGADLRTVYLGSIFNDRLLTFRSPVAGAEPVHWRV